MTIRRTLPAMAAAVICGGFMQPVIGMSLTVYIRARGPFTHVGRRG